MVSLAIPSLLVGAVMAQRFKVMILLPATGMMLMAATGIGLMQSYTAASIILIAAAASVSMQAGYLLGLGLRYLLEAPPTESPQPTHASTSARTPAQTTPLV